jgi:hypothetical protein
MLTSTPPTRAGVDQVRVVTRVIGAVQKRNRTTSSKERGRYGAWKPVRVGEVLHPVTEVRTGAKSGVWLQRGDHLHKPAELPDDTRIDYAVLGPNTTVRMNSQYDHGRVPLVQVLRGRIQDRSVSGRIPAGRFYTTYKR